ncbi:MAG: RpoL/Rpb11 RNA polymerase subunit family protein [Nanoarchaeota archaeon]
MEINVLKSSKDEIEMQLENLTMVELLRVYLNKDPSVTFAAWKREHPTEKPIINVKTKGKTVKKAVADAIDTITKDLEKIEKDFKAMK